MDFYVDMHNDIDFMRYAECIKHNIKCIKKLTCTILLRKR